MNGHSHDALEQVLMKAVDPASPSDIDRQSCCAGTHAASGEENTVLAATEHGASFGQRQADGGWVAAVIETGTMVQVEEMRLRCVVAAV